VVVGQRSLQRESDRRVVERLEPHRVGAESDGVMGSCRYRGRIDRRWEARRDCNRGHRASQYEDDNRREADNRRSPQNVATIFFASVSTLASDDGLTNEMRTFPFSTCSDVLPPGNDVL